MVDGGFSVPTVRLLNGVEMPALGRGGDLLKLPAVVETARRHGRSPAQIVLRWHVQSGYVPAPKSADPVRQRENLDVFGWALDAGEMAALDALDRPDAAMFDSDVFGH